MVTAQSARSGRSRHSRKPADALEDSVHVLVQLGQLRDALSLIHVATRSLESIEPSEPRHVDQEIAVLRTGLAALEEAYNAIDRAAFRVAP